MRKCSHDSNINKFNKKKKSSGCIFAIMKCLIAMFLIILSVLVLFFVVFKKQKNKELEEYSKQLLVIDTDEYVYSNIERYKNEKSDIDGLTKYEKLNMGLSPNNGSDTDGDGLSDKDEIEIYNTDPLKISTSGDNIPDGYKIKNSLDINKKYDDKKINYLPFYYYDNINLKNKNIENSLVSITEIDGYKIQGINAEKVYNISNYNGKLTIDFSDYITNNDYIIFKKNDEAGSDYEVLKDKKGVVNINTKGLDCVVGLIEVNKELFSMEIDSDLEGKINCNDSLVVLMPLSELSGKLDIYVFESSVLNVDKEDKQRVINLTNYFKDKLKCDVNVTHKYISIIDYKFLSNILSSFVDGSFYRDYTKRQNLDTSEEDISDFIKFMQLFIVLYDVKSSDWNLLFNNTEEITDNVDMMIEKPSKYMTTFDISKDALPFPNFGSYISNGGNCAGFSLITTQLFNDNLYSNKNEMIQNDIIYNYDISNEDEFSTFFDKYLYDYKSYNYWRETYPNMRNLSREDFSDNDANFIDFIGYKFIEGNTVDNKIYFYNFEENWESFEKVIDYFENNNKILNFGLLSTYGAHMITAYGLEKDKDNPNIWYIYVYDCNFPNNKFGDEVIDNRVKVVKKSNLFGEDYFEFDYRPCKSYPKYRFTSYLNSSKNNIVTTVFQGHSFVMFDDNFEVIIGENDE